MDNILKLKMQEALANSSRKAAAAGDSSPEDHRAASVSSLECSNSAGSGGECKNVNSNDNDEHEDGVRKSNKRKRSLLPTSHRSESQESDQQDKKVRRETANSNERRRMMSINNGFVNLQNILPKNFIKRGEKMSKATVLQSTVDYIKKLIHDQAELQAQNETLAQKMKLTRMDSGTESHDEGSELDALLAGAPDLVTLAEHWKAKYSRERRLRAQTIEEFRRLILDAMQCCPSGLSKRDTFNAALLRSTKSPTPGKEFEFPGTSPSACSSSEAAAIKGEIDSFLQATSSMTEDYEAPIITIPDVIGKKRKSSANITPDNERKAPLKPLTGFDILYQAILSQSGPNPDNMELETIQSANFLDNLNRNNNAECTQEAVGVAAAKRANKRRK